MHKSTAETSQFKVKLLLVILRQQRLMARRKAPGCPVCFAAIVACALAHIAVIMRAAPDSAGAAAARAGTGPRARAPGPKHANADMCHFSGVSFASCAGVIQQQAKTCKSPEAIV